jgi:antitoxin (DNA-binding transcriptional repressor) of toxin-antitoxin stability system
MRKMSIRELHIRTSELVREAEGGAVIVIERRGVPVAELRPLSTRTGLPSEAKARIRAQMEKIWASMPVSSSNSTGIVEEDRNR